jgi:DNA-binding transcriptional ArsR family regulator
MNHFLSLCFFAEVDMKEVLNIKKLEQAKTLMNPVRIQLLQMLAHPQTCAEVSERLGLAQQRVNHHLKELLKAGLIRIAKTRRVRNLLEATYEAAGKAYWVSPSLLRPEADSKKFRDQFSLHNLLIMTEAVQEEVGLLLEKSETENVPSIGINGTILLSGEEERNQFSKDLLNALEQVINKYQKGAAQDATRYSMNLMCYPKPHDERNQ